jgi:hypothetical protein
LGANCWISLGANPWIGLGANCWYIIACKITERDFVGSTAVARANAYIGGYGSLEALLTEIELMGLSQESAQELVDIVSRYGK